MFQRIDKKFGKPQSNVEKSKFKKYIEEEWDKYDELKNLDYYTYLGQKPKKNRILKNRKEKKDLEYQKPLYRERERIGESMGLYYIKEEILRLKDEWENVLRDANVDTNRINALKVAYVMYKKTLNRLLKLSEIRNSSYKFASVNIFSIDYLIKKTKIDFYNFLDLLF